VDVEEFINVDEMIRAYIEQVERSSENPNKKRKEPPRWRDKGVKTAHEKPKTALDRFNRGLGLPFDNLLGSRHSMPLHAEVF
jgi:hypothetical protein